MPGSRDRWVAGTSTPRWCRWGPTATVRATGWGGHPGLARGGDAGPGGGRGGAEGAGGRRGGGAAPGGGGPPGPPAARGRGGGGRAGRRRAPRQRHRRAVGEDLEGMAPPVRPA